MGLAQESIGLTRPRGLALKDQRQTGLSRSERKAKVVSMPAQSLSPNNLLLFLIGRPGAGKSTFARYLSCALISTRVLCLNDYDLLLARVKKLSPSKIKWEPNGQFEILDPSLFDKLFNELVKA